MKKVLCLLLFTSSVMAAQSDPVKSAVAFNRWYITQISQDKSPITDGHEIDKFVTASTLAKLRQILTAPASDDDFYDADIFIKAQDIDDDWESNVTAIAGDTDPICTNVYVAFGKKRDHVVIDCMVKEAGVWKVQSVALQEILSPLKK